MKFTTMKVIASRKLRLLLAGLWLAALLTTAFNLNPVMAQTTSSDLRIKLEERGGIKINSADYPTLGFNFTAAGPNGPITNMKASDIQASIDNTPVTVSEATLQEDKNLTLSVFILVDTSRGMYPASSCAANAPDTPNYIIPTKKAIKNFATALIKRGGNVQINLGAFNGDARLNYLMRDYTSAMSGYTNDTDLIFKGVENIVDDIAAANCSEARPYLQLNTAIADVATEKQRKKSDRAVVLLLTGAQSYDKNSDIIAADVSVTLQSAGVVLYTVGIGKNFSGELEQSLSPMSKLSGGDFLKTTDPVTQLDGFSNQLVQQLLSIYRVKVDASKFLAVGDNREKTLALRFKSSNLESFVNERFIAQAPVVPVITLSGIKENERVSGPITPAIKLETRSTIEKVEYQIVDKTGFLVAGKSKVVNAPPWNIENSFSVADIAPEGQDYLLKTIVTYRPPAEANGSQPTVAQVEKTVPFFLVAKPKPTENNLMLWIILILVAVLLAIAFIVLAIFISRWRRERTIHSETITIGTSGEVTWSGPKAVDRVSSARPTIDTTKPNGVTGGGWVGAAAPTQINGNGNGNGNGSGGKRGRRLDKTILDDSQVAPKAWIYDRHNSQRLFPLKPGRTTLGRDPGCDVVLDDPTVSANHAVILEENGRFFLQDTGSRAGSSVNNSAVLQKQRLANGDVLTFGKSQFIFKEL